MQADTRGRTQHGKRHARIHQGKQTVKWIRQFTINDRTSEPLSEVGTPSGSTGLGSIPLEVRKTEKAGTRARPEGLPKTAPAGERQGRARPKT